MIPTRSDPLLRWLMVSVLVFALGSGLLAAAGYDTTPWLDHLPGCVLRGLTGVPCPGCGMTRAFWLLGQLRFAEAFAMHPLAPALVLAMTAHLAGLRFRSRRATNAWAWVGLGVTVGIWLVRLGMGDLPA